ncbi:hypothetical protein Taro_012880 [Colocasia esculenta]|uniref:Uncharacterized protein n=1 Tax=Colocasia esculenta TaxID=4460 RepID=A0A843UKG7_COLES|nr:hypothetical protein [Colocasia esculenta]
MANMVEASVLKLFDAFMNALVNLSLLDKNAGELRQKTDHLRAIRIDMTSLAQGSGRLTRPVMDWIDSVDALSDEVDRLLSALDRSGTGCLCCLSHFKLGLSTAEKLREVRLRISQSHNLGVLVGVNLPDSSSILLGRERTLAAIRDYLGADNVWVVGIYGMGGSGKTTLLKRINNQLLAAGEACLFDALLWVTVSSEPDVRRIQDAIGSQLGLHLSPNSGDSGLVERAGILFRALKSRKFLLLLDDLWAPLNLAEIGIPHPTSQRGSKITFTTRSLRVCAHMDADVKVTVKPLDMEASWMLFGASVGTKVDLLRPPILPLARRIVEMCGGLPLALIVAGRAMAEAKTVHEWEHASSMFGKSADGFQGMDRVLSLLKLSYDRLQDEQLRQCFLYCSLFSEGHPIPIEELIDYWVAEGFLEDTRVPEDMDAARSRGHFVVERLKSVSLLESDAGEDGEIYVTMHDIVREMALWITSSGEQSSLLLTPGSTPRSDVVRIAVVSDDRSAEYLTSESLGCPNLLTLLFHQNTHIHHIPIAFFSLMPLLRVLDLSGTRIRALPEGIASLTQLRFLNLSDTFLRTLPTHFGRLANLRQLNLRHTIQLETISSREILSLSRLQKLDLYNSAFYWSKGSDGDGGGQSISLEDLNHLPCLNDLRLNVKCSSVLVEILKSAHLSKIIRYLTLQRIEDLSHVSLNFNAMIRLRRLGIEDCSGLQELTLSGGAPSSLEFLSFVRLSITNLVILEPSLRSLKQLHILSCHTLKDLNSVHQLPHLQSIDLRVCNGLEVLVPSAADGDSTIFPQLKKISLYALANFKCICPRPLLLPRIEYLEVYGCPMFMKLPLDYHSANNIKQIVGTRKWWDALQWDEDRTKWKFHPFFRDPWQEEEEEEREQLEQEEKALELEKGQAESTVEREIE